MLRSQKVFIIDFDNTILDIDRLKNHLISKFPSKNSYTKLYNHAKISGHFRPEDLPEKYQKLFLNANFQKYLFPKAVEGIKKLQKIGRVIIFTYGNESYQKLKINKSGIGKVVGRKNILVVENKKACVESLIKDIKKEGLEEIVIIDDVAEVLEKAFEKFPQVITVWIRYGKYKNRLPLMRNSITYETRSFTEAVNFIENLVTTITIHKSHVKFPILKEIAANQISDLVSYTGRDKKVSVCTHDDGRFKNKKTFASWKRRGKIIYTLTDRKGKLLGFIWFAKKTYRKFHYTVATRIYPPIRRKGLSYKFLKPSVENFYLTHKKAGLWLMIQKGNIPAEHLYKKFGFRVQEEKNGEIVMSYSK